MMIVEATIVFPVMFIIIFLLIFMGNGYYQKSRIEAFVNAAAIEGAARCVDPMLSHIEENGSVPDFGTVDNEPYRYVFGGMDTIEENINTYFKDKVAGLNSGFFNGMQPIYNPSTNIGVEFNKSFIASSFDVNFDYKIRMPIRLLGESDNLHMFVSLHNEIPVMDSPDFIQNTDMVEDYLERFGIADDIHNALNKITEMSSKAREWFNR
ncbi:MAG: pilus assembly protein [Ruminococcus sp.]|nr:pilus assembly protein [Ruminococcus sp.]